MSVQDYQDEMPSSCSHQEKKRLHDILISLTAVCLQFLEKMTTANQFTFLSALNKVSLFAAYSSRFFYLNIEVVFDGFHNRHNHQDVGMHPLMPPKYNSRILNQMHLFRGFLY